jgi:hypothetical protein
MTVDDLHSLVEELQEIEDPSVTGSNGPLLHWPPDNDQTD